MSDHTRFICASRRRPCPGSPTVVGNVYRTLPAWSVTVTVLALSVDSSNMFYINSTQKTTMLLLPYNQRASLRLSVPVFTSTRISCWSATTFCVTSRCCMSWTSYGRASAPSFFLSHLLPPPFLSSRPLWLSPALAFAPFGFRFLWLSLPLALAPFGFRHHQCNQ